VEWERLRDLVIVIIHVCDLWRVCIKKGFHQGIIHFPILF
jgi:hypothetical protein